MKKSTKILIITLSCLLIAGGAGAFALFSGFFEQATFEKITDNELFKELPLLENESAVYNEPEDVGAGNTLLWIHNISYNDYTAYLKLLEKNGYVKFADNGEGGLEGYVYMAHYQKDDLTFTVTYYMRLYDVSINACRNAVLSDRMIFRDDYAAGNIPGAKTTLTVLELNKAGNSFVFQLKNGHYIVNDGGVAGEIFYLLDFLEEHAPGGEKPVVEAWFISHAHQDHMGVLRALLVRPELAQRISVEGLYFTSASDAANEERRGSEMMGALTALVLNSVAAMKTSDGSATPLYRMHAGERYYFSDITVDVVFEQSVLDYREWTTSNAQSTTLMYTVEGQKVYIPADTDYECQLKTLDIYDDKYFDLAIYLTPHHGGNVYDRITDHLTYKTVVDSGRAFSDSASGLLSRFEQQKHLISRSEEHLAWGEGGLIFTFPYSVGEFERLPLVDWTIYQADMDAILK
ncbi:MAG: hypothetical protein IJS22_04210 [Lachnospiraceae bacterium]|nr:hypothetical protein [Lachnospiraceae bacterium]